ncbi:MAG: TolC family protein [Casimicrobiaceae bacterium]
MRTDRALSRRKPLWTGLGVTVLLAGCATTAIDGNFRAAEEVTRNRLGAEVKWLTTDEARRVARTTTDELLARPLDADDAVRIALAYSPAVQALLFERAADAARITQGTRLPNPVLTFERLLRQEPGVRELEITRMLAISIGDLLLLPSRLRVAEYRQAETRARLAGDVAMAATLARQAWVRAVAAQQMQQYVEQVKAAADVSAELARRMQAAGNFSKLQRAREQVFAAEAVAELARAQQVARSTREALVRTLGLDSAQAQRLQLPDRLPDLPKTTRDEAAVLEAAFEQRVDVRVARASLEATAREQGLTNVARFVDGLHLAGVRTSETGLPVQKGYEVEVPLPIFDLGDATRAGAQATYMATLNRTSQVLVDAASQVREIYGAYRTTADLARHYRDEIVPLRKAIAEENVLRYNGMLIGVFELLADARAQTATVVQAIAAQRDFWLADAALQAALIGQPVMMAPMEASAASAPAVGAGH